MGQQACYHCNLLFDVDPGTYDPRCLQCSQPLVIYDGADQSWLGEDDEPTGLQQDKLDANWMDGPAPGADSMSSTRLVGVLDLPLPGEQQGGHGDDVRTRMLAPVDVAPPAPPPAQPAGDERTRMLSPIDAILPSPRPAPARPPAEDERTSMFQPVQDVSLGSTQGGSVGPNLHGSFDDSDASTRMFSPVDVAPGPRPPARPAPRPAARPTPQPIPRAQTAPPMPPSAPHRPAPAPQPISRPAPAQEEPAPTASLPISTPPAMPQPPAARPTPQPPAPKPPVSGPPVSGPPASEPPTPEPPAELHAPLEEDEGAPDALGALVAEQTPPPALYGPRTRPRRRRSPLFSLMVLVVVLASVGGVVVTVMRDDPYGNQKKPTDAPADPAMQVATEEVEDELSGAVKTAGVALVTSRAAVDLESGPYLLAGEQSLATSFGMIPGLPSAKISQTALGKDRDGLWVKPALTPLQKAVSDPSQATLLIGVDRDRQASLLKALAYTGHKAGYDRLSLMVRKADGSEAPGQIPFSVFVKGTSLPTAGIARVNIDRRGIIAQVYSRDGEKLTEGDGLLPRLADGERRLDLDGLDVALETLVAAHPQVRQAIITFDDDTPIADVVEIFTRLRSGSTRDRFTALSMIAR